MGVDLESKTEATTAGLTPSMTRLTVQGKPAKTKLRVEGMSCSGCARSVGEALRVVPGVAGADVQLEAGEAVGQWQADWAPGEEALLEAVSGAGYKVAVISAETAPARAQSWSPLAGWKFNVVIGTILTVPLFICEWILGLGMAPIYHLVAFCLVMPVQTLCGARFYRGAWNQLKIGSSNMDTLVALGSSTAFGYSTWALFSGIPGHLFFMESASVITLISIGHWLENKASARAAQSLRALLDLAPPTARLLDAGGAETRVPLAELHVGDRVVIKPGDRVPADAEVVEGASVLDESMLTGESTPVSKTKGSTIYGGTANLQGWVLGRIIATGESTALSQIIAVVERAQNSRAQIQRLGDRVSNVFVPIVVLIALATGLWWS